MELQGKQLPYTLLYAQGMYQVVHTWVRVMQDLSHNRTIDTGSSSWVTACEYMPTYKCLAVTTFSRSLTMYDITSPFCTVCGSVPKMDYTPMTMDIWPDRGSTKESEMVLIGDSGGMVHLHRIQPNNKQDSLQAGLAFLRIYRYPLIGFFVMSRIDSEMSCE